MKTEITAKLATILGRAAADTAVRSIAMDMLRHYALNYEIMHADHNDVNFEDEANRFAAPPTDTLKVIRQWDGEKPQFIKEPYRSASQEIYHRVFEQNFLHLISGPVESYWDELSAAITVHLNAAANSRSKSFASGAQSVPAAHQL